jgi:hypothetical protein
MWMLTQPIIGERLALDHIQGCPSNLTTVQCC